MTAKMTFAAAAAATGGQLRLPEGVGAEAACFEGVSIDSRSVARGQAFVAIAGERFDGHDYLQQATSSGAALLVFSRSRPSGARQMAGVAALEVADTRRALGQLGRAWREQVAPTVVAITGSLGKTTTKELTRQVLSRAGKTHCTAGNYNNDIGAPLTLLAMPADARYLVAELGMNAPGEIAYLASLTRPDVAVVTNVAAVHLEGLGSIEAVARAKGELFDALDTETFRAAIARSDDALLEPHLRRLPKQRCWTFGEREDDRVRIVEARLEGTAGVFLRLAVKGGGEINSQLPLVGRYNAFNAAAAATVGVALEVPLVAVGAALAEPPTLSHRSGICRIGPFDVLDDCYNASPRAVMAALETVGDLAARDEKPAVAILGEMLELGAASEEHHREVGAFAAAASIDRLITVGRAAEAIAAGAAGAGMATANIHTVAEPEEAAAAAVADPGCGWLLVKASRAARLERVLGVLRQRFERDD